MQPHNWHRVKDVFDAALDVPAGDERQRVLEGLCAGDAALRQEVESLLGFAATEAPPVAAAPPGALVPPPDDPTGVDGQRIGPYRLVRELGHGGMGTVYLARRNDGQFQHEVAIKVIRHALSGPDIERRFRAERQILASLNHPHIAQLLDGGVSDTGASFLVMEHVQGEPILAFAERAHLRLDDRLRLFAKVCSAVAYAHATLVVHRDIKPSNILVTAAGEPKLLDFGLAKIVDAPAPEDGGDHTVTMFRAFTPSYASPEQVLGHAITTASDVYSLGVVLYELLSGTKPFDASRSTVADMLRVAEGAEAPRPSAAPPSRPPMPYPVSTLAGDLDNIVLMALRREPERRYGSVTAFIADIERYLGSLPVSARPHTWSYRAVKFAARHTTAVAATLVAALALLGGLGTSVWQAALAREQRDRATRRFEDVRRLSNSLLFELSPKIERLSGATDARDLLVRRAVEYLDSLAAESADDVTLQSELASAYEKVGDLQGNPTNPNLIELDAAIRSYEKARVVRRHVLDARPDDRDAQRAFAENHRVLGGIHSQANNFDGAERDLREALARYEALATAAPGDRRVRLALAQTTHDLGRNHSNSSRYAGALAPFERAIALTDEILRADPQNVDAWRLLADTRAQYGLALSWEGRQPEAEAQMARAANVYEPLVAAHPHDVALRDGLWSAYWLTSSVYEEQNDPLSHQFALRALDTMRAMTAQDPANLRARQQLAKSYSRLGQTATNTGHATEATGYLAEATRILADIAAGESRNGRLRSEFALALTRLAEARAAGGRLREALADAERAAMTYAELLDAYPADRRSARNLVLTHEIIGNIHERQIRGGPSLEHRRLAAESFQRALDLMLRLRARHMLADADDKLLTVLRDKAGRHATATSAPAPDAGRSAS